MAKTKLIPRPDTGMERARTIVERVPMRVVKMLPRKMRRPSVVDGLAHVAVGVAGGFAGAGAAALLVRAGASPVMSGIGVTLAGGAGAVMTDGKLRTFSASAAATGFSSAMLTVLTRKQSPAPRQLPPPARQAALSDEEIFAALRAARNAELGWDDWDGRNQGPWDDYGNYAPAYADAGQ
jgi:hypothetical protein